MAAICWYFNQLGGNSTRNKEESLLSVLQFLPQASAVRAYRKFSFMASAIDKLCRPHQTSLMIPRISSTGMVQTPTLPFKRISFKFIIYYTPVYFQYIHLKTGNTATKLMVLWWATAVRLVVCKFIERNTKHSNYLYTFTWLATKADSDRYSCSHCTRRGYSCKEATNTRHQPQIRNNV